jgi:hypothetical protein
VVISIGDVDAATIAATSSTISPPFSVIITIIVLSLSLSLPLLSAASGSHILPTLMTKKIAKLRKRR